MEDMKAYIKRGFMGLSRQVMEKNYQQQTLGSRLQQFKDTRRETRHETMVQRRNIDVHNLSPFESVQKKKPESKKIAVVRPQISDRLERLKKWKEEKEKRKLEEKRSAKPVFKVCHVGSDVGLGNYGNVNQEIKGKVVRALSNQSKVAGPSLVPKRQEFKAPGTVKPLHFNNLRKDRDTSSKRDIVNKIGKISKKATAQHAKTNKVEPLEPVQLSTPPTRRVTRLMSKKLVGRGDGEVPTVESDLTGLRRGRRKTPKTPKSNPGDVEGNGEIPTVDHQTIVQPDFGNARGNKATPKSGTLTPPPKPVPSTPSPKPTITTYISPFVTISRGKDSIRKEYKQRMLFGGSIPGNSATSPSAGAAYFSNKLKIEIERIESMCQEWSVYQNSDIPEEAREMIDVALGQSKLLMSKKFQQFKRLIERCGFDDGTKQPVTCMDLHGFWDMIYMQVEDIDKRFDNLSVLRSSEWKEVLPEQKSSKGKKVRGKRPKIQATSKIRDLIKQAKANNKVLKSPFVKINTPQRSSSSPGLVTMRLSQSIKKNDGLTPNRSILKSDAKDRRTVKNVLFDLSGIKNKLDFNVEDKENAEGSLRPLRRSRRLRKDKRPTERFLLSAFEAVKDPSGKSSQLSGDEGSSTLTSSNSFLNGDVNKSETPHLKKRHRRVKSSSVKNSEYDADNDMNEFFIVSLDNKQWHFDAANGEERDEWVSAIEQQILNSLQSNETSKTKNNPVETSIIQSIKMKVPGNGFCVDCDATNPTWASLNLGVLMCIECSGGHRNMGSHISRVRSIDLDDWLPGNLAVMLSIGNSLANSVWEYQTNNRTKPTPTSSREEKEKWIRSKYENKEFLPAPNNSTPLGVQLIEAVCASNMKQIIIVLARATPQDVNTTIGPRDLRTPLHLACAIGNIAVAQLLIWHNADVKCVDQDGRTCLAYAKAALSIANAKCPNDVTTTQCGNLVELLLSYGCPEATSVSISGTIPRRRTTQFEKSPPNSSGGSTSGMV